MNDFNYARHLVKASMIHLQIYCTFPDWDGIADRMEKHLPDYPGVAALARLPVEPPLDEAKLEALDRMLDNLEPA